MAQYMKNMVLRISGAALLVAVALPVWAGHGKASDSAYDNSQIKYAKVLDARPVREIVRVPEERQVCEEGPVRRRVAGHNSAGATIFGSILGGVIGSQFGGGSGKTVATIAGATIGGAIAHDVHDKNHPEEYQTTLEQRCYMETNWYSEERVVAWDVDWRYRGKTYHSRLNEHPGDRLAIRVSVNPVHP